MESDMSWVFLNDQSVEIALLRKTWLFMEHFLF